MRLKVYVKTFILLLVIAYSSCKDYSVEDNKVYYKYWNEGSGNNKVLIKDADANTFSILKFNDNTEFLFAKDKNHLYIDGKPIKNIDPATFTYMGNYIFRDVDSAYFFGFYNDINDCSIKGIDPDKIELIQYPWAKAGNMLIHGNDTVRVDNINDFKPIDEYWGKTKAVVLNNHNILKGADPLTFEVISSYSGKDKAHVYEFGKIID